MTVVFAVKCSDGVVMGADSQVTDSDRGMSYPAQKLHPLGEHAAWGGSGARSVLGDLERIFNESPGTVLDAEDVSHALQEVVMPVLQHHYEHYIPDVPGEETQGGPSAYVLAAGYANGEPFIVEVTPNAMVSRYEDLGFHAIGSGAPMAHQAGALLSHFQMGERSIEYGLVGAVRVLDALALSSPSVGGPVDLCRIDPDGARHLDEDEIEQVRSHARRWIDLEQKALDSLFD